MSKKIIAVVGATGAQGGGLVRAILADPSGGFAARALTRDADARQGARRSRSRAPRSSRPTWTTRRAWPGVRRGPRRVLRDVLLGPLLAGEGAWRRRGNMAEAAKAAGVKHAIWSTLEDTRQLGAAVRRPHADADGQVQGAALRRQGRGRPLLHASWRADDLPADLVLLGQPHLLRHGPEEGAGRHARVHAADGRQEAAGHRGRGHRPLRLRHLQAGPS